MRQKPILKVTLVSQPRGVRRGVALSVGLAASRVQVRLLSRFKRESIMVLEGAARDETDDTRSSFT
jgi:hypothetical protein